MAVRLPTSTPPCPEPPARCCVPRTAPPARPTPSPNCLPPGSISAMSARTATPCPKSRDTDKKKAFGGNVVKILQTDYSLTLQFSFLESINADVLRAVYGDDNVTVRGPSIRVRHNKRPLPHASWVIDTLDSAVGLRRIWIPDGQITTVDDVQIVHTETIAYKVTVECFEDADGTPLYEWVHIGRPPTQWTVTVDGKPTGGEFTLAVDGKSTAAVGFDATNAAVRAALAALPGIGAEGVTVPGRRAARTRSHCRLAAP